MTKPCKSCKEQIDATATKCPKCQAYQQWYRSPPAVTQVMMIPFLAFMFWNMSGILSPTKWADYRDKLIVGVVDENPAANGKAELLTVRVENQTNKTWKRPKFQIESLDENGKTLSVEHVNEYNLVLAPHSSTLDTLSFRIVPAAPVAKRRVTLTDIDSNRF